MITKQFWPITRGGINCALNKVQMTEIVLDEVLTLLGKKCTTVKYTEKARRSCAPYDSQEVVPDCIVWLLNNVCNSFKKHIYLSHR